MGKKVAIIFGGQSSEHEVSCVSACTIIKNMDPKYEQVLIGITKEGKWLLVDNITSIEKGTWVNGTCTVVLPPDATRKEILLIRGSKETDGCSGTYEAIGIDVVFPVLHGLYGEDGTIQGLFELSGIPYVGCGVLACAVSMDKFYTKVIVDRLAIHQAQYVEIYGYQMKRDIDECIRNVEEKLSYPVFVKPSRAGSSKGVSKAENRQGLMEALHIAVQHDTKILVEETIIGRELECAVMGTTEDVKTTVVGEILSAEGTAFYDYDAKYNNAASKTVVNPKLPDGVSDEIRRAAKQIFKAVDGFGLARIDFFLEKDTNRVVFNELNPLPGFTSISMYPMLWKGMGMEITELISNLIELAYKRGQ